MSTSKAPARAASRDWRDELVWNLRTLPQRLGMLGVAGILLGAGAAALWLFYLVPTGERLTQTRHVLELRKATIEADLARLPPVRPQAQNPQDALFSEAEFQSAIERFIELARSHSITLMQGAYKLDAERDSDLRLAVLNFPAQGNYVALRAFLADAHQLPGVRLQSLQITRVPGAESDISVQIQFSMLLRK